MSNRIRNGKRILLLSSLVGNTLNTWETESINRSLLGTVALDDKCRVLLDKKTREIAGINKRDKLVAIPFKGGVILVAPLGHKFRGSLTDFEFAEERHEASRFIFRRKS